LSVKEVLEKYHIRIIYRNKKLQLYGNVPKEVAKYLDEHKSEISAYFRSVQPKKVFCGHLNEEIVETEFCNLMLVCKTCRYRGVDLPCDICGRPSPVRFNRLGK
jgi:hypothetical protein